MIFPLVVNTAAGSRIYDLDGNELIDLTMAFGSSLLGYNPDLVKQALSAQLEQGIQVGPKSPLVGEAAQLVRDLTGCERVAFANSGTEAVMTAVRMARAVTGRTRIVRFAGSYHGHSDTMLVKAGGEGGSGLPIARRAAVGGAGCHRAGLRRRRLAGNDTAPCRRTGRNRGRTGAKPAPRPATARISA
ncbi:aminotransferase class III-fold pyridoxal phosphate-dependent enzyme [Methylomonas koyamae]|uniref:aminotransferase class III-fold pyridoxal phosphate-dependent enzyme n=1 Tax=Methylomonas koyamae TaxID=702114 RepID=UPI0006D0B44A|nr:aminotransferase class III-fold pyridoxal phosphate-dependent enzyme [Methylomonas koyamae]